MQNSSANGWWALAFTLILCAFGISTWRLLAVPDLSVSLDSGLIVRSAGPNVEGADPQLSLARGDQLTALAGHQVQNLLDVMSLVRNLNHAAVAGEPVSTEYQAVRPLHRFTLTLRGTAMEPGSLPPGIEPTDKLVEVDGRALPGKVGPEGLQSIVASRPEAVLGFERANAVFTGKMPLKSGPFQAGHYGLFAMVLLIIVGIWRGRDRKIDHRFAAAVGIETAVLSLVGLLVLRPQWVQADLVLATMVVVGFVLPRAIAFVGRGFLQEDGLGVGPIASLVIAVVGASAVSVMMARGILTTELGLQFAATLGVFFIVYELVSGFSRRSMPDLGPERGIFLTGVVVLSTVAGLFAYLSNPVAFVEEQWIPFSATILGLMWFGDSILCVRGPATSGLEEVVTPEARQSKILDYFDVVGVETGPARFRLVLFTEERSVALGLGLTGFEASATENAMHDALSILVREGAQVPSGGDIHGDPLAGIAETMQISLATRLAIPDGGIEIPRMVVILVAFGQPRAGEKVLVAPISATEVAHRAMTATIWASAHIEGLPFLTGDATPPAATATISPKTVETLKARIESLENENEALLERVEEFEQVVKVLGTHSHRTDAEALLEPDLVKALHYLLKSEEPLVIGGPVGAGKEFVAQFAASLDSTYPGPVVCLDIASIVDETGYSEVDDLPDAVINAAHGGSVIVRGARLLDTHQIKALLHRCSAHSRVYLLFDDDHAEERSVLEPHSDDVKDMLEHRELIVPAFARRRGILGEVIRHLVVRSALRHQKEILGIAAEAMRELEGYEFPGNVAQCVVMVNAAVSHARGDILEVDDFPGL